MFFGVFFVARVQGRCGEATAEAQFPVRVHVEPSLQVRVNRRPREGSQDDNPDLTRYVGNTELTAAWLPGRATAALTWRLHPKNLQNGSVQLDWTYPVDSSEPQGLRWYLQLFSGYGESLLDYNHRQTSLGLGLSLFQF